MSEQVLPCFVCGKELKPVDQWLGDDIQQQAADACAFRSYGQYGSAVFDPADRTYLEVNICDECLTTRAGGKILRCQAVVSANRVSKVWNPVRA